MSDHLQAARDAINAMLKDAWEAGLAEGLVMGEITYQSELGGQAQPQWDGSEAQLRTLSMVDAIVERAIELADTAADQRFGVTGKSNRTHTIKTWGPYFERVLDGTKTFEVRVMDRNYEVADDLVLREWDHRALQYTGRSVRVRITYIAQPHALLRLFSGWPKRICVMGIRIV